jgi:FkbM family methyltransferase
LNFKTVVNITFRTLGYQFISLKVLDKLEQNHALDSTINNIESSSVNTTANRQEKVDNTVAGQLSEKNQLATPPPKSTERVVVKETIIKNTTDKFDSAERFKNLKNIGFTPKVIMDCGAFVGKWAKEINVLYPDAQLLLVEPNNTLNEQIVQNTKTFDSKVTLLNVAVSDIKGDSVLNVWVNSKHANKTTALAASSLMGHVQGEASVKLNVKTETIDSIINEAKVRPDLLKLDLQGAELPALNGAKTALESVEVCVIEFGCLDAYIERTTPVELCQFMSDLGFVLYDIWDLRYRPYDNALAGGDFVFVKTDSVLREHKDYF